LLSRLVGFALAQRLIVLVLAALLVGAGLVAAGTAPIDVFPEFAPPQVTVQTEAPGFSATEVEALVTIPLEQAINGVPGLVTLRSESAPGLSAVFAVFSDATDVYLARQVVNERLQVAAGRLPAGAGPPQMTPLVSASSTVLDAGLTAAEGTDPMEVRAFADWVMRPRILAIPGVSRVTVFGGGVRQYQVLFSARALREHDISVADVTRAAATASAQAAAGFLPAGEQTLPIRARGMVATTDDLSRALVAYRAGVPITLAQVAEVRTGPEFKVGDAAVDGEPGVILEVDKLPGANTLEVTRLLEAALAEIAAGLPPGMSLHPALFRQANFVERAVGNLEWVLWIGVALVVAVLLLFLLDLRTALVSLTAIPLSLLAAILVLRAFGVALNTMTIGGLAIAVGEVVDDAIIDVENILRRLRENRREGHGRQVTAVILDASIEVRSAVVYATFIVALVFMPVFFLSGFQGRLLAPLGLAYVAATLSSLVVALTVTPALASLLLVGSAAGRGEGALLRALKSGYGALLARLVTRPRRVMIAAALLFAAAVAFLPGFGVELLPDFEEADSIIHMAGLPGTALETSMRAGIGASKELLKVRGVVTTGLKAGRAGLGEDTWGPEQSEITLALDPTLDRYGATLDAVRRRLEAFPGFVFNVAQFLRERIDEILSGTRAEVVERIQGSDLEVLRAEAARDAQALAAVRGAAQVQVERQGDVPQIAIEFDRDAAARHGLTMADLRDATTTALWGTRAGQVYEGQKVFDIWVRGEDALRSDPAAIAALLVDGPDGSRVPLASVAGVGIGSDPNIIGRQGGTRRILVTASAEDRDIGGFVAEARRRVEARPLPAGYFRTWEGEYEAERRSRRELLLLGLASCVGVFLLLVADFRSARLAGLVLVNLPLALIGGVAAAAAGGGRLSIGSLVGFITLFGISTRNSIMLVSRFTGLEEEGMTFGPGLVVRGALDRLAPILMTTLVTGLALLPLVVSGARAGQEIEHPMAVIILGGLASSTVLNLLVLPSLYVRFGGRRRRHAAAPLSPSSAR
jgi:CzcA family heavy metal efflux pump